MIQAWGYLCPYRMSDSFASLRPLAGLIPGPLRRGARDAARAIVFRLAMRELVRLPAGATPSRGTLARLRFGWGNDGYAARADYLEEVARLASATRGPVLECGSGLTTLLVGLLAGRRGVETWALEHSPEWHARVAEVVRHQRIPNVRLRLAPLRDYGGFEWYEPPAEDWPREFRLIVCDGPPGATRGGRYGLLPVVGPRLAPDALILLDDAGREGEREVLRRWETEANLRTMLRETPTRTFAHITRNK